MRHSKDIREQAGNIALEAAHQPSYPLVDLVNGITEENLQESIDFGAPEGEEAW